MTATHPTSHSRPEQETRARGRTCAAMRTTVLVLACAGGNLLCAASASAEPFTRDQVQLAAAFAYGVYVGEASDVIPSPYGVGVGARAGYTLGPGLYAGAEGNYFFGANRSFPEY